MNIHVPSLAIGAGIAAIAIIGLFFVLSGNHGITFKPEDIKQVEPATVNTPPANPPKTITLSDLTENGSPILGDVNAPITVVEYGDYQCFFCNKFFHDTEDQILENYIKTGKIKIIFKDFTIIGPDSVVSAHATHCADEQGKFWEYHDALYNHWTGENNGWASLDNQLKFAQDLGLDKTKFTECMSSDKYKSQIETTSNEAKTVGFTGTPGFLVIGSNNKVIKVPGAQPYDVFVKIFSSPDLQK